MIYKIIKKYIRKRVLNRPKVSLIHFIAGIGEEQESPTARKVIKVLRQKRLLKVFRQ